MVKTKNRIVFRNETKKHTKKHTKKKQDKKKTRKIYGGNNEETILVQAQQTASELVGSPEENILAQAQQMASELVGSPEENILVQAQQMASQLVRSPEENILAQAQQMASQLVGSPEGNNIVEAQSDSNTKKNDKNANSLIVGSKNVKESGNKQDTSKDSKTKKVKINQTDMGPLFGDLFKKLNQIHDKNLQGKEIKKWKMGIFNDIAALYVEKMCHKKEDGSGETDQCDFSNDPENKDVHRKQKIYTLIKALEHPKFVLYVQSQDNPVEVTYQDGKKIEKQLKLDDTRRLVVSILRKYNSENFIDLDEILYRFFPRTFDGDFRGFSSIPDRIQKKTEVSLKGYRSELDEDNKQKFGRLVPSIKVTYPNGFMEKMLSYMLEVDNFLTANSKTGDDTRDKDIDKPLLKEVITATENQFYPGAHFGNEESNDNTTNPIQDVNINNNNNIPPPQEWTNNFTFSSSDKYEDEFLALINKNLTESKGNYYQFVANGSNVMMKNERFKNDIIDIVIEKYQDKKPIDETKSINRVKSGKQAKSVEEWFKDIRKDS